VIFYFGNAGRNILKTYLRHHNAACMVANKPICTNVYDNEFQQPLRCCILCNSSQTILYN